MCAEAVGGLSAPLSRHRPVISTFPVISMPANPTQRKAWVLFLPLSQMLEVAHKPEPPWGRPTLWSLVVVMYQIFLTANGGCRGSKADGGYITSRVEADIAVHWDHRTGGRGSSVALWRTADVFLKDLVMVTLGGGCASSLDSQMISDPDGGVTRSLSFCYIVGSESSHILNILANCVFLTSYYFPTCLQDLAAALLRLLIVLVMFCSATLPTGSVVRWGGAQCIPCTWEYWVWELFDQSQLGMPDSDCQKSLWSPAGITSCQQQQESNTAQQHSQQEANIF